MSTPIISFVMQSSRNNFKPFRNQPLGILYLLTIIDQEFGGAIESSLIDLRGITPNNVLYHVPERDIYFYSVTTPDFTETTELVVNIRKIYPKAKHIAGGPHIDVFKDDNLKYFDAISLGQAEESIKRIIRDHINSSLRKVYKQEENIDINKYPFPSRKYLSRSSIIQTGIFNKKHEDIPGTDIILSKGCPFNCHFCANLVNRPTQLRKPELITEEIEYLKSEYGIKGLVRKDDQSIPVNTNIAKSSLEAIRKTGVVWRGQSRANNVQLDMVKLAQESGCIEIAVGMESVSQEVLNIINKKINFDKAMTYLRQLKEVGIDRKLLLILGLPGEPADIADRTIAVIKETEPTNVLLSLFCPMPGSEIYNNPQKFGIKIHYDITFDHYRTAFGRFDEKERPSLIFEYEKTTPFGKGKSTQEIIDSYQKVQAYLRENGINC